MVAAITVVGAALRLVVLHDSLFADELSTYWIVSEHGLGGVISTVHTDAEITPPLYFVLAWLTTRLDLTVEMLRAPSFLAGVAAVPLVYLVGARTVGRTAALVAAAITALSPFMVYYSTEARGYELMVALALLSTLAMLVALDDRRARWWALYAASSCAAVYSHYTAVFVLGAQLLWLLWARPEAGRPALLANLGAALAFLPWISGLIADLNSPTTKILGALEPFNFHAVRIALEHWSIGHPARFVGLGSVPGTIGLILIGLGVAVAIASVTARGRPRATWPARSDSWLALIVVLALAAPVSEAAVSLVGTNILSIRNLAVSWPAFALLLAILVTSGRNPMRIASATLLIAGFGIGAATMLEPAHQRPDYEAAARLIDRDSSAGDVVIDASVLSPGPFTGFDTAFGDSRRVLRAGAPQEKEHPFGVFNPVLPLDKVIHSAVAAARHERIYVVSLRSEVRVPGLPVTYSQLAVSVAERLSRSYRVLSTQVYPGILPVAVQIYGEARRSSVRR
jgi:hypothetical protein